MKICIFVKGAANRGKTTTIKELARLIGVSDNSDLWDGLEIKGIQPWNGVSVALHSKGDPGSNSFEWIREKAIEQDNCEIIVAACRRGGSTQDPILPELKDKGYTIVEVYPSMIKVLDGEQANYQVLAKGLAHQILFIMNNRDKLSFSNSFSK